MKQMLAQCGVAFVFPVAVARDKMLTADFNPCVQSPL